MRPRFRKEKPHAGGRRVSDDIKALATLYGEATKSNVERKGWREPSLPSNWRERLPRPEDYYPSRVQRLTEPNALGWAAADCPFCQDCNRSLSLHLLDTRGGWRCAKCGEGGDLLGFHQRVTGLDFRGAVRELLGGAHRGQR